MALVKAVKAPEKSKISIVTSRNLADEFNQELDKFNQKNGSNINLDFDALVSKLVKELKQLNRDS